VRWLEDLENDLRELKMGRNERKMLEDQGVSHCNFRLTYVHKFTDCELCFSTCDPRTAAQLARFQGTREGSCGEELGSGAV
jgi:hypothetical protein